LKKENLEKERRVKERLKIIKKS